jgi:hypothetical protein
MNFWIKMGNIMGNIVGNNDNTDIEREERGRVGVGSKKTAEPEFLRL